METNYLSLASLSESSFISAEFPKRFARSCAAGSRTSAVPDLNPKRMDRPGLRVSQRGSKNAGGWQALGQEQDC